MQAVWQGPVHASAALLRHDGDHQDPESWVSCSLHLQRISRPLSCSPQDLSLQPYDCELDSIQKTVSLFSSVFSLWLLFTLSYRKAKKSAVRPFVRVCSKMTKTGRLARQRYFWRWSHQENILKKENVNYANKTLIVRFRAAQNEENVQCVILVISIDDITWANSKTWNNYAMFTLSMWSTFKKTLNMHFWTHI